MLFVASGRVPLFAHPFEEITPDQKLYQRVKKLGDYGLLDPRDKAVLDQGKIVTRLELAFYTEKAKARISAPQLFQPAQPTPTPASMPELMTLPPALAATPTPEMMNLPPALAATPTPLPAMPLPVNPNISNEIDQLLKELKQEAAYLQTRLSLDDQRIKEQEKELEALQNTQDDVSSVWKKANKSVGSPNFSTKTRFRFENLHMSGITVVSATRTSNGLDLGMWSDIGGKGAISLGLTGYLSDSNFSAASAPASVGNYAADISFALDGPVGHWDSHFMVQGYPGAGTLGDFTRGIGPTSFKRYQNPADIKPFSDDKDLKTWDDYMNNISPVPPSVAGGAIVSGFDRVFSGIYGVGTNLPLIGEDARMVILLGRMGSQPTQTQRWEEALKISRPLGPVQAEFSTEWMNDQFGINQIPQLDFKSYELNLGIDLKPVAIGLEAGFSHLYSGINNGTPVNTALEAPAGQASLSFYPFNIFYTAISDGYSNFQSKVAMASVNFNQYQVHAGPAYTASGFDDAYGLIGEVDNLVSNRVGWRVNLGWEGRKQDWMKNWPGFLDDFILNFDVAQKKEYQAIYSPAGYNVIEAFSFITPYYGEDEGLWGLALWGGYAAPPWLPARQSYVNNIQGFRNDGNTSGDAVRYQFRMSSERIPLILPADTSGNPLPAGSQPATFTSGPNTGKNSYVNLSHLKSYNYITLTTKWQINKTLGIATPFYGSFFFTDNSVSGQATTPTQSNISNLFGQTVYDFTGFFQAFRNVNLMAEYGWEVWKSAYTWPLVDYRTEAIGGGLAYDIPWGGAKFEVRYKHVTFKDTYVPANNFQTDQWISELYFLF